MDYVMRVKYSTFHKQFFYVFTMTQSPGILARMEAQESVIIVND